MSDSHKWAETILREYLGAIDNWPAGMCNYLDLALQEAERAAYERAAQECDELMKAADAIGKADRANAYEIAGQRIRAKQQGEDGG